MILTPKNWNSFQHYKDRAPAWIKLHKGLLDDFEFCCLPVASKALAPFLWLLASEYEGGKIDASLDALAFRLRMSRGELADALSPLIEKGFFDASEPLAECKQDASPEREEEEENIDKRKRREDTREDALLSDFEEFWAFWPNKVGKPAALKAFRSAIKRADLCTICDGAVAYERNKPPDRPWLNPATFLNQNRWEDRPAQVSNGQRTGNTRTTGHDAILAAATREARKIVGDGGVAGSADEDEFPGGAGPDGGAARGHHGSPRTTSAGHDGREPFGGTVLEGEIVTADEADARLPGGWRVIG